MRLGFGLSHLSIRQQLIITIAAVHTILMTVFVIDLVTRQRTFLHDQQAARNLSLVQGMARHATDEMLSGNLATLQEIVNGMTGYPELRYAMIVDESGKVLAHTDTTKVGAHLSDAISLDFITGRPEARALIDNERMIDVVMPVLWKDDVLGWARFSTGKEKSRENLQKVTFDGAAYAIVAIVLGILLAYRVSKRLLHQLYELLQIAEDTRAGQRERRAKTHDANEVGQLASSFNAMLDTLADREHALELSNATLEHRVAERTALLQESEAAQRSIIERANDAFITMDAQGRINAWNHQATLMFGWSEQEAIGQMLSELIVPPASREGHRKGLQRYLETGEATVLNKRVQMTAVTREGAEIPVELSIGKRSHRNQWVFDAFIHDITERKQWERMLAQQALQDVLTGLPNRRALTERLPQAMARADRWKKPLALMFLDLDGFKGVNDRYGHEAGDLVLIEFAQRLRATVREVDTVARLAGDEFVIVLESLANGTDDVRTIAAKIIEVATKPFIFDVHSANLSTSIGVAMYFPGCGLSLDTLMKQADEAMYATKRAGKNNFTLAAHGDSDVSKHAEE